MFYGHDTQRHACLSVCVCICVCDTVYVLLSVCVCLTATAKVTESLCVSLWVLLLFVFYRQVFWAPFQLSSIVIMHNSMGDLLYAQKLRMVLTAYNPNTKTKLSIASKLEDAVDHFH